MYHAEISSAKVRGLFCSFTQLFLSTGLVFIYLLSTINTKYGLHYYDSSLIIVGVIGVYEVLMYFLPESPRWLIANGSKPLAIRALKTLRGPDFSIQKELDTIESDLLQHPRTNIFKGLRNIVSEKSILVSLLTVLVIMGLQQMSGRNATSAYASVIFTDAGVSNPSVTASYAIGVVGIVCTFSSIFVVDCLGRKVLLVTSGIGMLLGTVMLGTHFYITRPAACNQTVTEIGTCNSHIAPLAIVSLIIYVAFFSIGWGPIPWILLGELLPTHIRGLGSAMANFVNWGSAAIVAGFYFKYEDLVNPWFAWWTFSIFNICGIIFAAIFLKETKKKVLEDI